MKQNRQLIALLLSALLVFLAACGGTESTVSQSVATASETTVAEAGDSEASQSDAVDETAAGEADEPGASEGASEQTKAEAETDRDIGSILVDSDRAGTDLSVLQPWDWDDTELYNAISEVCDLLEEGSSWDGVFGAYERVMDAYDEYADICSLYSITYDCDPSDAEAEDAYYAFAALDPYEDICLMISTILASDCREDYIAYTGNTRLLSLSDYSETSAALQTLYAQESKLAAQFDDLYYDLYDLPVEYDGSVWTWDSFSEESYSLSDRDYYSLGAALEENENQLLGTVLVNLVNVRNHIAALQGYDNYYDMIWDTSYFRDYTYADYESMRDSIITYITVLEDDLYCASYDSTYYYYGGDGYNWDLSGFFAFCAEDESLSADLRQAFAYMDEYNLLILPDATGYDTGYMSKLFSWDMPYIYLLPYSSMYDLISLSHETGHALNGYFCTENAFEWGWFSSIDVSEVQSNATTLMLMDVLADFQPELADEIRLKALDYVVESLPWSALSNDVEYALYTYDGTLTLDIANELATDVWNSYGYSSDYNYTDRYLSWVESAHMASYPGYTISYVTSSAAALALWMESIEDSTLAWAHYDSILRLDTTETDFMDLIDACGFETIFTEEFYQNLAQYIRSNYLN